MINLTDSPSLLVAWFVFLALSVLVGLAIGWFVWRKDIPAEMATPEPTDDLGMRRQVKKLTEQRDRLREQLTTIEKLVGNAETEGSEPPSN